ncbi:MAG: hypothetical protein ACE366_01870 [Bradymonadia bacterium]
MSEATYTLLQISQLRLEDLVGPVEAMSAPELVSVLIPDAHIDVPLRAAFEVVEGSLLEFDQWAQMLAPLVEGSGLFEGLFQRVWGALYVAAATGLMREFGIALSGQGTLDNFVESPQLGVMPINDIYLDVNLWPGIEAVTSPQDIPQRYADMREAMWPLSAGALIDPITISHAHNFSVVVREDAWG